MPEKITLEMMARFINGVFSEWPHYEIRPELIRWWHSAFRHVPPKVFLQAMMVAAKTSKSGFPPKVADCTAALEKIIAAEKLSPAEAWALVFEQMEKHGARKKAAAQKELAAHVEICEALKCLGWERLCYADTQKELGFLEHKFKELYALMLRRRSESFALPEASAGSSALSQLAASVLEKRKRALGEKQKCISSAGS